MKSSGPVFTRQDPFKSASTVRRREHYHPSRKQSLSKKEKDITLSPERLSQKSREQLHCLNQGSHQLLGRNGHFSAADEQPVFKDIWPSTDGDSSPKVEKNKKSVRLETLAVSQGAQEDSVLARYIERFRHGQPQSRDDRQQMATFGEEIQPFWWMSHTTDPSKLADKNTDRGDCNSISGGQRGHDRSVTVLSDSSQGELDDTDILHLQERASKLLLRSEGSLTDGSVHVSSEGLGCSDFSSPVSVEEPVRLPLTRNLINPTSAKDSSESVRAPTFARPEEDILFQWRLRRKMEQARERPRSLQHSSFHASKVTWQTPGVAHSSATQQHDKQQHSSQLPEFSQRDLHSHISADPDPTEANRLHPPAPGPQPFPACAVPSSSVSQPQAMAHVPAHMHLLCDVLPCAFQSSAASQRTDEFQTTPAVVKKPQVSKHSLTVMGNMLDDHMSPSPCPSHGATEGHGCSHQKVPENNKKKKAETKETQTTRHQRKAARASSHPSHPKKVASQKEQRLQEGSQALPKKSCHAAHVPPPSPVHSALGQVVSEVLFPAGDSPPAQKNPASSLLPHTVSSHSQTQESHNSLEVISQLLLEAEDSDEKEFEDDPLLQVLRQQRKWVKDQISEVDVMLNDFPEKQQVS
ncbi:proline and serine-rich protein 3 [Menidia menidia]